jgi:hypothetical protein
MGSANADDVQQIEHASVSSTTATQHRRRNGWEEKFIKFKTVIFSILGFSSVF